MIDQNSQIDVFLNPGEIHFGDRHTRIRTFLGSCVSIVFWHPQLQKGGMCHFMLPGRNKAGENLDGRYADEAIALLLGHIERQGRPRQEYQVKLFGGGDMFPHKAGNSTLSGIGKRNICAARGLIAEHGLKVDKQHLGGHGHRVVSFDVASGEVLLKHMPVRTTAIQYERIDGCDFNATIAANASHSDTITDNNPVTATHLTSNPTGIPCNQ
jgi:chemotaxis protein CheD